MPGKRKRDILDGFDPNKSDPEDENFEPDIDRPTRTRKKSRATKSGKSSRRGRHTVYRGSDIDDDDDISDSEQDLSEDDGDEESQDEDEDEDDMPINEATGRRRRRATAKRPSYKESSDDDESVIEDSDDKDELTSDTPKKKTSKPTKIVIVKLPPSALRKTRASSAANPNNTTRRSTRARTAEADEELVELSNSGKHALPAREHTPQAAGHTNRPSRAAKGLMKVTVTPIEEATQESTIHQSDGANEEEEADLVKGDVELQVDEDDNGEVAPENAEQEGDGDHPMETIETNSADDEDDGPITRRLRGARAAASALVNEDSAEPEASKTTGRRLRRRTQSRKSGQEPSSDFEPENDSEDDNVSDSEKGKDNDGDEDYSSGAHPRGRKAAKGRARSAKRSQQADDSDDDELDRDELAEEAEELRQSSRAARRRRRSTPSIEYHVHTRRLRKPVDYSIKPIDAINEPDEEDPAPTPARRGGRRTNGAASWEHSLHSIAGPFGGVNLDGTGALFGGPWGTGATGGVDSDSSDDEMGQRTGAGGNIGMTPTSAAPAALGGAGPSVGVDGLLGSGAGAPNVGKIKNPKAYADADPLGVDMSVDFSKVGGLQGHIDQLKEMVQLPLLYPELFAKFHVTPPRGVLFHGPPGTGKTLLARALANSVGIGGRKITFYMRKGADALSKWVGEAEKQLRLLFEEARRTQPSIIFFDEIDGLAPVRSSKQEQIHASIVSTLLALMDGMDGRGQVIVIGATNRPDNIDPALRRPGRFDREFYFPLPDVEGRKAIIDIHTKDWGLSDKFKMSLARDTKGYGGADLRAMCTEAALNAIQRTYPQIYSSKEKLIVNPDKISIHMTDFSLSKKKIVPSSERASTSGAAPLPKVIEPLLRDQLDMIKTVLDDVLPQRKKVTALEEAMFEPYDDEDFGFGREALNEEFERSRVFRPRLLVCGQPGMGHSYISSAILHYLEGVNVQSFDLSTVFGDSRTPEQVLVGLFTEVKRQKPSVIFIPNVDAWYSTLQSSPALTAFLGMLRSIQPTDPIMVLGTAESGAENISPELKKDLFGFSRKNHFEIVGPSREKRREYFSVIVSHIRRFPKEFPDPTHRRRRVLEDLPLAPPPSPKVATKEEERKEWLRYRQLLNLMKVHLQPIMEQINKKYRSFRNEAIPYAQYQYLFEDADPTLVHPDLPNIIPRPFERAKDSHGIEGLRETATGKFFYNLNIQTIEERLANGYYIKPLDFLRDVRTLEKDAKALNDRTRMLKASELVTNVEVDVNDVNQKFAAVDWDELYQREQRRREAKLKRANKKKAMQAVASLVTSDLGSSANGADPSRLHTTTARFEIMSPLSNGNGESSKSHLHLSNGTSIPSRGAGEDVPMTDVDLEPGANTTSMQPPSQWPHMEARSLNISTRATTGGTTQLSQVSAVQSLPPGVSPSALVNDASTTKTSDPSNRSSDRSTQMTNGIHHEQSSPPENLPDTQPADRYGPTSQAASSDEQWLHSQAHGISRGILPGRGFSQGSRVQTSSGQSPHGPSVANLLNDFSSDEPSQSQGHSGGSSASQQVEVNDESAEFILDALTTRTSGCTVEQLEQLYREMMNEIWSTRGEHNRMKVYESVTRVFNETINDIEKMQSLFQSSQ